MEAAYGTAKNGVVALMGMMRLELVMNSIMPVVVAGVLGLACGLAGVLAGMTIGFVGETGVRMISILIFVEALALYGLIVGIILSSQASQSRTEKFQP